MNSQRNFISNEQGATSIFVIILMVVLFVFGLAALTTALSSLKLSQKNVTWNAEYYALEAQAEEKIADIDAILFETEKAAIQMAMEMNDENQYSDLYFSETVTAIEQIAADLNVVLTVDPFDLTKLMIEFNVTEADKKYPKNISVQLMVILPAYEFDSNEGSMIRLSESFNRYQIIKWQEWQNQFEYEEELEFENPDFNVNDSDSNDSPFN